MIDAIDDPRDGWQFGESTKTGRLELRGEYDQTYIVAGWTCEQLLLKLLVVLPLVPWAPKNSA